MESHAKSSSKFFVLLVIFSLPFWLLGELTTWQPLPGVPISAFMFFCPSIAAIILTIKENESVSVIQWITYETLPHGVKSVSWLAPAIFIPPSVALVSYGLMKLFELPLPQTNMDVGHLPWVFLALFVSGFFEQLGWSAYAVTALQQRHSALSASLLVGLFWAAWHVIPLTQAGRSDSWIVWWCLMTVSLRVVLSWLYNSSNRSVLVVAACQSAANTSWQFFPNYGSHYDPKVNGLVWLCVAILVVVIYNPRNLRFSLNK